MKYFFAFVLAASLLALSGCDSWNKLTSWCTTCSKSKTETTAIEETDTSDVDSALEGTDDTAA